VPDFLFDVSTVPAFQDAFIAQLRARPALLNVSVVTGPPSPGIAQESQWISLLEVTGQEKWAAMGRLSREETYTQRVYISVITRDGASDATNGRNIAYALRAEVSEQLHIDPTINDSVWQSQITDKNEFYPRLGISVPNSSGGMTVDLSYREAAVYFDIFIRTRMFRSG
jgi:hypothetical protein